jgi:hypothetical protein
MTQVSDGARQTGGASFRVGLALSHTLGMYRRGFVKFTLLAWTYLAPLLLVKIAADFLLTPHPLNLVYEFAPWVLLPVWIIGHGACVLGAVKLLDGEGFETKRSFLVIARRLRPLLGLVLCVVVAGALGLLYFTPGVIVFLMFCVGGATRTVERTSLMDSFKRTLELTRGHRRAVLGVYLVFLLATIIVVIPSMFVMVLVAVKIGEIARVDGLSDAIVAVGDFTYFSIFYAIGAVLTGVVYRDLRIAKEGTGDHGDSA